MPFGLDLKSLIAGVLLVMFVIPWITSMLNRSKGSQAA